MSLYAWHHTAFDDFVAAGVISAPKPIALRSLLHYSIDSMYDPHAPVLSEVRKNHAPLRRCDVRTQFSHNTGGGRHMGHLVYVWYCQNRASPSLTQLQ